MLKRIIVMMAVVMTLGSTSFAQTLKLGYVHSGELVSLMPATKLADQKLKTMAEQMQGTLKAMYSEYETKVTEYQTNVQAGIWPESTVKVKQDAIIDLEGRIQQYEQSMQKDLASEQERLYEPILKEADDAIKAVAKEGSYTYIFDASTMGILFAEESENILAKVRAKLGI